MTVRRIVVFISAFLLSVHVKGQQTPHDSVTIAIAPGYDSVTNAHRFLFGESYRKLWAAPVKLRVFRLQEEKGGLTIEQRGGGMQTRSLRLIDKQGKEWVLRTIQKYPERGLPENLRETIAKDILQDQVVTAHPYSSVTVPPLATALGIPHANPEIVYVPDDTALGIYRADFANAVFLFEEREPLDAADTDNTEKTQRKLEEDNDVRVDQPIVLRARLLDMLLGDWDRHEDQWRWQKVKEKKKTVYTPVPRDRDQVYYNTTGVFPWIISHQWLKSKFQGFHESIRDINGFNFNARYFDRYFLNGLSTADWEQQISYVQEKLSDSLIRYAVQLMPDTIYRLSGEKIIQTLMARRNGLRENALKYRRFIARNADIPASDKQELFDIVKQDSGVVNVKIYKVKKDGSADDLIYQNRFQPADTKEIRLYGMGGHDFFSVKGKASSPIVIRMIGGNDRDSFHVAPEVRNNGKLYIYDRSDEPNVVPTRSDARIRTDTDSAVNNFNRRSFLFDRFGPLFSAQYNPDQGLMLRANMMLEKQGFRKTPYAQQHQLIVSYVTGRESFMIQYLADFKKLIGKNDLRINLLSRGPNNLSNFFGLGNETVFENNEDTEISYYRNRYDLLNGDIRLYRPLGRHIHVNAGVAGQFYTSNTNNNHSRFLKDYNILHPEQQVFNDRLYAGLVAGIEGDTRNSGFMPFKGVNWHAEVSGMQQTNGDRDTYGKFTTDFSFYVPLAGDSTLVMANRVAGGTSFGQPAFFQMMPLGGAQMLRGFHTNRFTGQTALYHNLEFRLKLFNFASYLLPGTVGIVAFHDVGRVWLAGESSNRWHHGYGGGLYIVPADLFVIQATVGFSKEGTLPYITAGFRF